MSVGSVCVSEVLVRRTILNSNVSSSNKSRHAPKSHEISLSNLDPGTKTWNGTHSRTANPGVSLIDRLPQSVHTARSSHPSHCVPSCGTTGEQPVPAAPRQQHLWPQSGGAYHDRTERSARCSWLHHHGIPFHRCHLGCVRAATPLARPRSLVVHCSSQLRAPPVTRTDPLTLALLWTGQQYPGHRRRKHWRPHDCYQAVLGSPRMD